MTIKDRMDNEINHQVIWEWGATLFLSLSWEEVRHCSLKADFLTFSENTSSTEKTNKQEVATYVSLWKVAENLPNTSISFDTGTS